MPASKKRRRKETTLKAQSDAALASDTEAKRLAQLDLELQIASTLCDAADGGRHRAECALAATIDYLCEKGFAVDRLEPLISIVGALIDADKGARHPMLIPQKVKHRPPTSTDKEMPKVIAAVALDLLIRSRTLSKTEAERTVVSSVRRWKLSISKEVTRMMVSNWRERISTGPHDDFFTQRYWQLVNHCTQNFSGPDLAAAAHQLLRERPPLTPKSD